MRLFIRSNENYYSLVELVEILSEKIHVQRFNIQAEIIQLLYKKNGKIKVAKNVKIICL